MIRLLLLLFSLSFFSSAQAQSCSSFAQDLGLSSWTNQGICLGVSRENEHKCFSYVANKRNLDCRTQSSDGWACKNGYIKVGQLCKSEIFVPKNAFKTSSGWSCKYNFIKDSSGKACKPLPSNSIKTSDNSFRCNFGYEKNSSSLACISIEKEIPKTKPDNSYFSNLTPQGWKCRGGFYAENNTCKKEPKNIPENAIFLNGALVCGVDYILNKSGNGCQKVPLNGYSINNSNFWLCKVNFQKSGDRCVLKQVVKKQIPDDSSIFNDVWQCDRNFRVNRRGDGCEKVPLGAFSPSYSNQWFCISKYIKSGDNCIKRKSDLKIPINATISASGDKWFCDSNFRLTIAKNGCEQVPPNSFSRAKSNMWGCESGYYKNGRICKERVVTKPLKKESNNSDKTTLIIAAIIISLFIFNVFKKSGPPSPVKPKEETPEKPKEETPEKPKKETPEKPKKETPEKPRRFVVKDPKVNDKTKTSKTEPKSKQKFYAKNSLSLGDIETQKKKINWSNTLDGLSRINNSSVGYLVVTELGLSRRMFEVPKELSDFFAVHKIHDFENHTHGQIKKIQVQLVSRGGVSLTEISLYGSNMKKPFPRIWITSLKQHAEAQNLLVFKVIDNVLYVINNAHDGSYGFAHLHLKYLLKFNKSVTDDKFKFEQNKLYSRKDVGLICLPKTGRPKGGMWDTGYVKVGNNLIIFMNIGVPGRTEHDFNNSVNERSKTITWYGKPNSHSFQPTFVKLLSGELTPYFFARWDSNNVNFKFLGIGKIIYWRDGTPTLSGNGDKAETIEINLTYQSITDKKLITVPKPLKLIGSDNKPKVEPKLEPKKEPKIEPKIAPKIEPKIEPKVKPNSPPKTGSTKGPKITINSSDRFNLLNFDQSSVEFAKLVSRGVESIDVPTILGLKSSNSHDSLLKEKLKNNINKSLKSKELISLEKQAIKTYSENVDFDLQKYLIQDKENPLLIASVYSSDERLNNLSSIICNEEAYLLAQIGMQPPEEIFSILQHQLMVSGKDKIKYLSYWKGQACIAADIDRNDEFIDTLVQSEIDFLKKLY